jgi:hypothetical protein
MDKPLHVIYKVSKLAYKIWVILIANKKSSKKVYPLAVARQGLLKTLPR